MHKTSDSTFVNREFGQLEFNRRVLFEAASPSVPLLERIKFLSIFSSNIDEFFMKRVGGIKSQIEADYNVKTHDGFSPSELVEEIRKRVIPLMRSSLFIYSKRILPELKKQNIFLLSYDQLEPQEREWSKRYYQKSIFPALTPLAVDPGHPFPFISNLSISLGILLKSPSGQEPLFARVKIPKNFAYWIELPRHKKSDPYRFVDIVSLITANIDLLFPDLKILDVMPFRITRSADIERDEEDAEDLLEMIEEEIRARRFAEVVRLEHIPQKNSQVLRFLMRELGLQKIDIYKMPLLIDFSSLWSIAELPLPKLKFAPWSPRPVPMIEKSEDIFKTLREQDILVHHPFESFQSSVESFLRAAVDDPKVLAIKMTLYRTGDNSPLIPLLLEASERGKQVVCVVEVKARFDEARNIYWAQQLEKEGIHVVYGIVGLKTHGKMLLVVRQEKGGLKCYSHVGTGNYHAQNAKTYTDFGLFTSKTAITNELVEVFNYLTGRSRQVNFKKLLVAPINMRGRLVKAIRKEVSNKRKGLPAQITLKCNSFEDLELTEELLKASKAGVNIELFVRGFCCLKPHVKGASENITVRSTVGRFLEHSRIFYFRDGKKLGEDGIFFISSADWMYRNLSQRVELAVPIENAPMKKELKRVLDFIRKDPYQSWDMQPDGIYKKNASSGASKGSQWDLMRYYAETNPYSQTVPRKTVLRKKK